MKSALSPFFLLFLCGFFCLFSAFSEPDLLAWLKQSQEKLLMSYASELELVKVKKVDIQLTKEGFFRYRRTLMSGKQEYFAFNLSQLETMHYLGTTQSGYLVFQTLPESVIVQTFRDNRGNIDTMASEVRMPLKSIEADDLAQLQACFLKVREKLNATR